MDNKTALDYVEAINSASIDRLYELMAEDYLFIDAHDNRVFGRDAMKESWVGYFAMFPDYKIEITEIVGNQSTMCLLGYASGTYKNIQDETNSNYWKVPAAWKIIVLNGLVKHWQVYADNTFAIEIYNRNEKIPWGKG